jgi:formamidopyrimidine-DNA glycosylase
MPELPDIEAYLHALRERVQGERLLEVRLVSPFLLRTVKPPLASLAGQRVVQLRRVGKRIAFGFENDVWAVMHLMIAGRLHWRDPGVALGRKGTLASFDFEKGSLTLTEAGARRRASLYMVEGVAGVEALDPGGIDPLACTFLEFRVALSEENHTLKRALTDPRVLSGIGNAYSDEILHAAQLGPLLQTQTLDEKQWNALYAATQRQLVLWRDRFVTEAGRKFPEKVTAFRPEMAVHGKFGEQCPRCGDKVQRIRYADNETNYCARCQTDGKLLADRSLSRLLGKDWPKTLDELELLKKK